MAVTIKEISAFKNYGKCVSLSANGIEMLVTVDIGPRIISYGFTGGTNIMFNDTDRAISVKGEAFDEFYYKGAEWLIYGGHRLWFSPEALPQCYYPDHDPVAYKFTSNGAIFTPPPQKGNDISCDIIIEMNEDGSAIITHRINNLSATPKTLAPWALTVLDKGGLEIIPQNPFEEGLLANRKIIAWPYTDFTDKRLFMGKNYITLKQDDSPNKPIKIGLDNKAGTALYVIKDTVFIKKYNHNVDGTYPDFGVSFETYTDKFLELETLGELVTIAKGEFAEHKEFWSLAKTETTPDPRNEAQLDEFYKKYIK